MKADAVSVGTHPTRAQAVLSLSWEPSDMPLVNMKDMLDHAYQHNYAVGSFSLVSLEFLQGVIGAAENCRAPVILSLEASQSEPFDFDLLVTAVERAAQRASVPMAIHMHHGTDVESAVRAINRGCNGLMVDVSDRPLGESIDVTAAVVAMARGCGVPVEGALGYVPDIRDQDERPVEDRIAQTGVAEARGYVDKTRVDFLAVSIGTVRGGVNSKRKFNWQRLKQINDTLGIPLTIYGGSGMTQSQYSRLIENGVAKIDCYTALADAAFEKVRAKTQGNANASYATTMCAVQEAVQQETERCLRLSGAAGRAAEVLEQCRGWTPVEHVVHHDVQGLTEGGVDALLDEGRRLLSTLPGVREVCSGTAALEYEILRCSWQVRFCHPAACDSYRQHPAYVAFARQRWSQRSHSNLGPETVSGGAGSAEPSHPYTAWAAHASRG